MRWQEEAWPVTASSGIPRRVSVKVYQGETATVVVTVVQGAVWLSIAPPFTWEAILEPVKVDELIHVLELARDEAHRLMVARGKRVASEGNVRVRANPSGAVVPRNQAIGTEKIQP